MEETISKTIKWVDLYEPSTLYTFAIDLKYFEITDVQIDMDFRQTTLEGIKSYNRTLSDKQFTLIPDEVEIEKDKTISFTKKKTFNLSDFPNVLNFIYTYCEYISDFIQDQNIKTTDIIIEKTVRYSTDLTTMTDRINEFALTKHWLESTINCAEIQPLILASLIQRFYQQNSTVFSLRTTSALSRIKSNILYVNSLLNSNVNLLKTYKIKPELDTCVKDGRNFEFISNLIFNTHTFSIYDQNLDIKFLSYISCVDLREKALKSEPLSERLKFGESYPQNTTGRL